MQEANAATDDKIRAMPILRPTDGDWPRLLTPSMFPPFRFGAQNPRAGFEPDGTFE
jgi:hypothetical protein